MENTSTYHPNITLFPHALSSENGLNVVLKMIASGRSVPQTGGLVGKSGTAFFGYGSVPHRTIWCVAPAINGGESQALLTRALRLGLQRAAIHDLQKIGIELAPVPGSAIPPETIAKLVVGAVQHFTGESPSIEEFRLMARDAIMFTTAQKLISQPRG